ncbi:MAG: hypothetical protein KAI24_15690 [Planctomycetes bacterium]|nr:hypothetical protein [Planctomycetota bacterium]
MNDPSPRDPHEEMLIQLLSGEWKPSDERVQEAFREDPEFAREVDELLELRDELSSAAPIDVDDAEPWQGADRQVAELVSRELGSVAAAGGATATAGRAPRAWPFVLAAAAALLAAVWLWSPWQQRSVVQPQQMLGTNEVSPDGPTDWEQFLADGFRWNFPEGEGQQLLLSYEVDGEVIEPPIPVKGRTQLPVPDALRNREPPDELYWQVYYFVGGNKRSCSGEPTFR